MIVNKHKQEVEQPLVLQIEEKPEIITETEVYRVNALSEVYKAVRSILSDLKLNDDDPFSPPLFRSIKINNGQLSRLKNNKWNQEYAIAFPAAFIHFINVRYLVQQSRIGEGRADARIQYVLNTLNHSDDERELQGFELFQKINGAIQSRKNEFPALASRFQLTYWDQPESFDDGLQPYWIEYEVWFSEYSSYRYKDYVERYVVVPPFTDHDDQLPECNENNHERHGEPTIEEAAGFDNP